jgi:hypothetical protein
MPLSCGWNDMNAASTSYEGIAGLGSGVTGVGRRLYGTTGTGARRDGSDAWCTHPSRASVRRVPATPSQVIRWRAQPGRSSGRLAARCPCSRPVDWPTSIRYPSGSRR